MPRMLSVELNPGERIWLYWRERSLSLRFLESEVAIISACCDAWMRLLAEPARVKSLCNFPRIEKAASWTRR